jgi:mono/diheme cytochrome c family protein
MKCAALCFLLMTGAALEARAQSDPSAVFTRKCSGCHTFGNGVLVGPDLKGVTERHSRRWLVSWISSSERAIRSGDSAAVALFNKYRQQRMPDQNLSGDDVAALLDYFASGGPEADARRKSRRANMATAAEIDLGRSLFLGEQPLADGGASCSSCHRLTGTASRGGSLGPDLTRAYARFQDKRLASLLERGCFPRVGHVGGRNSVTDQESFALRAFLRQATMNQRAPVASSKHGGRW